MVRGDGHLDTREAAARAFSMLMLALLLVAPGKRGSLALRRRQQPNEDDEQSEEDGEQFKEDDKRPERGRVQCEGDGKQSEGNGEQWEAVKPGSQRRNQEHQRHRWQGRPRRWTAALLQILRPEQAVEARRHMQPALDSFVHRAKDSACQMQEAAALLDCKRGIVRSGSPRLEERLHQMAFLLTTTLELWEGLYAELMHPEGRGEHQRPRVGERCCSASRAR